VVQCDQVAIPGLTESDKQRLWTVRPVADEAVPLSTMYIDGVECYTVPVSGHVAGIAVGAIRLPGILNDLETQLQ